MRIGFTKDTSRLKKKLLLYFLLVSIVSISVSAEIIFEVSSAKFRRDVRIQLYLELEKKISDKKFHQALKEIKELYPLIIIQEDENEKKKLTARLNKALKEGPEGDKIFSPIFDLRNRMILLLMVITGCIIGAFFLFTKDIVSPMDGVVEATKKIADGDLTVKVPVLTQDEIGLIGNLINEMNMKLLDMIVQVKQDLNRHKDKIRAASEIISEILMEGKSKGIIETKRMKVSDFKKMIHLGKSVVSLMEIMTEDLTSLQTFVNMYKTYSIKTDISQDEIEDAIKNYKKDEDAEGMEI